MSQHTIVISEKDKRSVKYYSGKALARLMKNVPEVGHVVVKITRIVK